MGEMREWVQTKAVLVNTEMRDLVGQEVLLFVPFTLRLSEIASFRPSTDKEGDHEPYTNVFFKSGAMECIDMEWAELQKLVMSNEQS